MARKPKATTSGTEQVKPSETMKMPGVSLVKEAAGDLRAARGEVESTAETLRGQMAAHKIKGIHPAAVKHIEAKLHQAKKTDRGLAAVATYFAHLDYYRDVLGLTKLLQDQGQMFARPEAGEQPDDEAPEAASTPPGEPDLRPPHLKAAEQERQTGQPAPKPH